MKSARLVLRNRRSGRYEFSGDMSRQCVCGHPLGIHTAGGHDCQQGTHAGHVGAPCHCLKFKRARRR